MAELRSDCCSPHAAGTDVRETVRDRYAAAAHEHAASAIVRATKLAA
jgi:hypothetical protein